MSRNIVICSDGTGNAFARQVSNVTRLVRSVDLSNPSGQLVFYDQGIGTSPQLEKAVQRYKFSAPDGHAALTILPPPVGGWHSKLFGLTFGYGLRENVAQMYRALGESYGGAADQVFLIGFSRGAFTVRVLAGLVYRCGLPSQSVAQSPDRFQQYFTRAYALYEPHDEDEGELQRLRESNEHRTCTIHFLGLWDTVKSYGGVWPKSLPHLRHNPIVHIVRHALALHEQRSWFIPTSWGNIDADDLGRLGVKPHSGYRTQDVEEVWFRGCHSDIGGGDEEKETAAVPFRWMLGEAQTHGLVLNAEGTSTLAQTDEDCELRIHESLCGGWLLSEYIPRWELDNSQRPPKRYFKVGRSGRRHVEQFARGGQVNIHRTAWKDHPVTARKVGLG